MNLLNKISYGLYLLASKNEEKNNACIVNTLIQQTSAPEQVSVTVNKANLTHDFILKSGICSILLLDVNTKFEVFKSFGMRSGKSCDKYENIKTLIGENKIAVPDIGGIGFFELKVNKTVDLGTHTQFICDITARRELNDTEPLTYAYYHANVKPKPQPTQAAANSYVCKICNYVHNGEFPDGFACPICKHGPEDFEKVK